MTVKLVLSDIDGTILDDQQNIDSNLKETIYELDQYSIPFILASARSPKGMYRLAHKLDIKNSPLACYNGALVLKNADPREYQPILSHELDNDEIKKMFYVISTKFPNVAINLYSGKDWFVKRADKWIKIEANIVRNEPKIQNLNDLIADKNFPVHKLLLISESKEIQQLLKYYQGMDFKTSSFYLSKPNYLEVTNKAASKESALRGLVNYYQIDLKDTMTIGDNFNDVPMLKLAGKGVAMANAPQKVKEIADVQTISNNDDGVSCALKKYVLNK